MQDILYIPASYIINEFQVFDRIRDKNPDILEKLILVNGDVTLPNLGKFITL